MNLLDDEICLIYDNLISDNDAEQIEQGFINPYFPWYFSESMYTVTKDDVIKNKTNSVSEYLQLVHVFWKLDENNQPIQTSQYDKMVIPLLQRFLLEIKENEVQIIRIKANLQTQHTNNSPQLHNTPHVDMQRDHYVLLYYVNDSDGDTIFFDNENKEIKRVSPKRGRFVFFNGKYLHTGSHPYNSDYRIVINYDLQFKEG